MSLKINKEKIKKIAQKYNLEMVLLFGSQVNGRAKPNSDIDIAYSAQKLLSTNEKIDLNNDLCDFFKKDIIDQVDIKNANPLLLYEISQNSKLIFGKEIDCLEFKAFAFRNYIDSESLFKLEDLLIRKRHKELGKLIYG
ncbi:MAG: nucleotidyltransferase domain-containing protein [Ignavibacteria bacterium]|nr:nucleotidyltransferase domain-containing protein [Ignavibacteria bacterium]